MAEDYYAPPVEEKKSNKTLIIIIVVVVVLILLCCCCVAIFWLFPALLGPTIGNTFSNIIEELATPVP